MTSIAHTLGQIFPRSIRGRLRPAWWRLQTVWRFYRLGGRIRYSREIGCFWALQPTPTGHEMAVAFRSWREFNRFARLFLPEQRNKVFDWLAEHGDCDVYWDIGSANGIEGCLVAAIHRPKVLFLEPFTPSIETILKSCYLAGMRGDDTARFEVVQALASDQTSLGRVVMHTPPMAGATANAAEDGLGSYSYVRTGANRPHLRQWVARVALDDLHYEFGLEMPNLVKIDVDGYEMTAMAGAERLLSSGAVDCWIIEVFEDNGPKIEALMHRHGYRRIDIYEHSSGDGYVADLLFVKSGA